MLSLIICILLKWDRLAFGFVILGVAEALSLIAKELGFRLY